MRSAWWSQGTLGGQVTVSLLGESPGGRVGHAPELRGLVALALAFCAHAWPEAPPSPAGLCGLSLVLWLCTMECATWR